MSIHDDLHKYGTAQDSLPTVSINLGFAFVEKIVDSCHSQHNSLTSERSTYFFARLELAKL